MNLRAPLDLNLDKFKLLEHISSNLSTPIAAAVRVVAARQQTTAIDRSIGRRSERGGFLM